MTPVQRRRMLEYYRLLLSFASCMRSALIHPVLPSGGRDITVMFSPTRSKMPTVLSAQERPNTCVCCYRKLKSKPMKTTKDARQRADGYENLNDNQIEDEDDALFVDDDLELAENEKRNSFARRKGSGKMLPIPQSFCKLAERGIRHFACEPCLEDMQDDDGICPLCYSLESRLKIDSGRNELAKKKQESVAVRKNVGFEGETEACTLQPDDIKVPRKIYCPDIQGGFRASGMLPSQSPVVSSRMSCIMH